MSPWRAGCGSASKVHVRIRKGVHGYWEWHLSVNAVGHDGHIGATGERLTWAEAFNAAREECMWWVR